MVRTYAWASKPSSGRPDNYDHASINLAILTGSPIRVAPAVLDTAAVVVEKQTTRDENGQEVIEQTIRKAATGEETERSHLDPETLKPIRVLFRQERGAE